MFPFAPPGRSPLKTSETPKDQSKEPKANTRGGGSSPLYGKGSRVSTGSHRTSATTAMGWGLWWGVDPQEPPHPQQFSGKFLHLVCIRRRTVTPTADHPGGGGTRHGSSSLACAEQHALVPSPGPGPDAQGTSRPLFWICLSKPAGSCMIIPKE